jgi:hypothetical protein
MVQEAVWQEGESGMPVLGAMALIKEKSGNSDQLQPFP